MNLLFKKRKESINISLIDFGSAPPKLLDVIGFQPPHTDFVIFIL